MFTFLLTCDIMSSWRFMFEIMDKKRQHIISLAILILVCFSSFLLIVLYPYRDGSVCMVSVNGKIVQSLPLSRHQTIRIETDNGYNVIQILDGTVSVIEANCANQICVQSSQISKHSQMISCLPHGLIITIANDKEQEVDSIAY